MTDLIRPEFEHIKDFMHVLATSKFDEDPINNEHASLETPFSHYKLGNFLDAQIHTTPKAVVRSGRNSDLSEILCLSSLHVSLTKIRSKLKELAWRNHFPHYKSMGTFCCHGHQSFDWICPKCFCSLSPTPMMLHIKVERDSLPGFREVGSTADHWFTISSPCEPSAHVS